MVVFWSKSGKISRLPCLSMNVNLVKLFVLDKYCTFPPQCKVSNPMHARPALPLSRMTNHPGDFFDCLKKIFIFNLIILQKHGLTIYIQSCQDWTCYVNGTPFQSFYMCIPHVREELEKVKTSMRSPKTGVTNGCEALRGCWDQNPSSLVVWEVLLCVSLIG